MGKEFTVTELSVPRLRTHWTGKWSFIYAVMSYSIGLGILWRFPNLMAKNGGILFLIPYIIMVLVIGLPLWILETGLGQVHQTSGLTVWRRIRPYFTGIGYASTILAFIINSYYIVVLAWVLHYFASAFTGNGELAWGKCGNDWNTKACLKISGGKMAGNVSAMPAKQFFDRNVLQVHESRGFSEPAGLQPVLVFTLLLSWIAVFLALFRGMRSLSLSVIITALVPYAFLSVLFLRGVTLPGAGTGLSYYLAPNFDALLRLSTWFDASTQVLFSYGLSLGALTTIGSYNRVKRNFYHQLFTVSAIHTLTALAAGATVFTFVGFLAQATGRPIGDFKLSGQQLAFVTLAQAFAAAPWGQLWAILFFSMMFILVLGSQFLTVEATLRAILDRVPSLEKRRFWLLKAICVGSFLVGLLLVTRGGNYVFQVFDYYGASSLVVLLVVLAECLVLGWAYGAEKFEDNLEELLGFRISAVYPIYWKYVTPPLLAILFLFNMYRFRNVGTDPQFPCWSLVLGWALLLSSALALPLGGLRYWRLASDQKRQATEESNA